MRVSIKQRFSAMLPNNSFVRGVIALCGGTIGAQVILVAASPILTRLYTPAMFGVAAVFVGFSSILGILATLRYEISIPQADSNQDAASIAALCFGLTVTMFVISGGVVFFFDDFIVYLFHLQQVANFLWLVPLFIFSLGLYQLLTFWNYRQHQFVQVASSTVGKNAGMVGAQLLLYPLGALALLGGQLFGQFIATVLLLFRSPELFRQKFNMETLRHNAWKFRKYPLFSSWSGVTGGAAQQAPVLMFAAFFSPVEAGLYSLSYRIIGLPGALIGTAVGNVFLPHAAEAYLDGQLGGVLAKVHSVLARLAMPGVAVLAVIAPEMFALVFGAEWREAGRYVQWLSIMLYANFVYSPISTSFGIMDRQDAGLLLHAGLLAVSVTSIWVGATVYHSTLVAVALYSVSCAVLYVWALGWLHRKAGNSVMILLSPVASSALRTLPVVVPVWLAIVFPMPLWSVIMLVTLAGLAVVLYYKPLLQELRRGSAMGSGKTNCAGSGNG